MRKRIGIKLMCLACKLLGLNYDIKDFKELATDWGCFFFGFPNVIIPIRIKHA